MGISRSGFAESRSLWLTVAVAATVLSGFGFPEVLYRRVRFLVRL
jgi:hypothetical protein